MISQQQPAPVAEDTELDAALQNANRIKPTAATGPKQHCKWFLNVRDCPDIPPG